jgi:hypothetical protein
MPSDQESPEPRDESSIEATDSLRYVTIPDDRLVELRQALEEAGHTQLERDQPQSLEAAECSTLSGMLAACCQQLLARRADGVIVEQISRVAETLSPESLERLTSNVLSVAPEPGTVSLAARQLQLVRRVDEQFAILIRPRLNELHERARLGTLSESERGELIQLTDRLEQFEADRLEVLSEFARLHRRSLPELASELDSKSADSS